MKVESTQRNDTKQDYKKKKKEILFGYSLCCDKVGGSWNLCVENFIVFSSPSLFVEFFNKQCLSMKGASLEIDRQTDRQMIDRQINICIYIFDLWEI